MNSPLHTCSPAGLIRCFLARIALLALLLFVPDLFRSALAQSVPALINYQGRLSNADGSPLPTGDYQLTFSIYDSATNTSTNGLIWGPQVFDGTNGLGHGSKIPVAQGYFNVMLGPQDTNGASLAGAFTNPTCYVEIKVGTNSPILPRQQILTAPFAFNSAKLGGYDWSSILVTGSNPAQGQIAGSKIQSGGITASQIANGTITSQQLGTGAVLATNIADGQITLQKLAPRQVGTNVAIGGVAFSGDATNQTFSGTGTFDVTNLVVTVTNSGRPVFVGLIGSTNGIPQTGGYGSLITVSGGSCTPIFVRGTNIIYQAYFANGTIPPGACYTIDFPPAPGPYTYKFRVRTEGATVNVQYLRLVAFEL